MATVKLLEIIAVSDRIKVFRFEKPSGFKFSPGQFAILSTEKVKMPTGALLKRSYSIASPNTLPYLEFCIALAGETGFSHHLHKEAKQGDLFNLDGPFGRFALPLPLKSETIFVAGGAGISPIRGMISSLSDADFSKKVWLIFGIRNPQEYTFKDEFEKLKAKGLNVVIALSDPGVVAEGYEKGFVCDVMAKAIQIGGGKEMYLCGPPKMIETTVAKAKEIGFSEESIHYEQW
jgi:propane monooxygenase reductase component